jgi:hypothetical protein
MSVQLWYGVPILVNGSLTEDPNCCCDDDGTQDPPENCGGVDECCFADDSKVILTFTVSGLDCMSDGTYTFELPFYACVPEAAIYSEQTESGQCPDQYIESTIESTECAPEKMLFVPRAIYFSGQGWIVELIENERWVDGGDPECGNCVGNGMFAGGGTLGGDCCSAEGDLTLGDSCANVETGTIHASLQLQNNRCCNCGNGCCPGQTDACAEPNGVCEYQSSYAISGQARYTCAGGDTGWQDFSLVLTREGDNCTWSAYETSGDDENNIGTFNGCTLLLGNPVLNRPPTGDYGCKWLVVFYGDCKCVKDSSSDEPTGVYTPAGDWGVCEDPQLEIRNLVVS